MCWCFAKESDDRFSGFEWTASPTGQPILAGVIGWIDCRVDVVHELGDHLLVVGRVDHLAHADDVNDAMVFCRGHVGGFATPP